MNTLVLGDALAELLDHRGKTPTKLGVSFTPAGVPVASAILVADGRVNLDAARHVSVETYLKWMPTPTRAGDVLLTSEAPLGRVARVPSDDPLVLGQRLFGLRGKPGVLDSGYLFYALQTERVRADLLGRSTGTTVVGIRQSALRKVRIPAPSYGEQRAIAAVLGALDDKIADNQSIATSVGALADTLFAQAGRGLAFSGTFQDLAVISGGGTPSTASEHYWGGDISWATPTDVTGLSAPYLDSTARMISADGLAACSSALHPAGSILMTSRATIGAFAIAQRPTAVNQGFIVVNARDPVAQWWLFHEMRSRVPEFLSHANGATFLELSRGRFRMLPVRVAEDSIMASFASQADALHHRAHAAMAESASLVRMRDALLPLLMSGKLRVRDVEKHVEEVV